MIGLGVSGNRLFGVRVRTTDRIIMVMVSNKEEEGNNRIKGKTMMTMIFIPMTAMNTSMIERLVCNF